MIQFLLADPRRFVVSVFLAGAVGGYLWEGLGGALFGFFVFPMFVNVCLLIYTVWAFPKLCQQMDEIARMCKEREDKEENED
jgi:uncharacterized membrane protein